VFWSQILLTGGGSLDTKPKVEALRVGQGESFRFLRWNAEDVTDVDAISPDDKTYRFKGSGDTWHCHRHRAGRYADRRGGQSPPLPLVHYRRKHWPVNLPPHPLLPPQIHLRHNRPQIALRSLASEFVVGMRPGALRRKRAKRMFGKR